MLRLTLLVGTIAVLGVLSVGGDATATTQVRSRTDNTAWWWYGARTEAQVAQLLNDNQARIVDIEVQQVVPVYLFNVAMVKNEGAYAKTWWWYFDKTEPELSDLLNDNDARLIDLERYQVGGQTRFAAVMVANAGASAKSWWWYWDTDLDTIVDGINTNSARILDLETYFVGSQRFYSAVMVPNTGASAKAWWWYLGQTPAQVGTLLDDNNARLIDIERDDPAAGTYNVVMEACPCPFWWWYLGVNTDELGKLLAQNGARLIDLESYVDGGGVTRFDVVMINNSNAITTRVGQLLRTGTDGDVGLYLKEVGGPVLAALQERRVFEPASTIKALVLLHAMQQVQAGNAALTDQIVTYPNVGCPTGAPLGTTQTLQAALAGMMQVSNNAQTRAAGDTFGFGNINNTGQAIGMTDTQFNQTIVGCGAPPFNDLTLADIGLLYEGVADGTSLNATNRATFFSLMAGKKMFNATGNDFVGIWQDILQIVSEEAPASLSAAQTQDFLSQMQENAKAGGYTTCARTGPCTSVPVFTLVEYRSVGGYAQIPFCESSTIVRREYVFGFFIDQGTSTVNADNTFATVRAELLREQIRSALSGWGPCSTTATPTQTPTITPTPTPTNTAPAISTSTSTQTATPATTQAPTSTPVSPPTATPTTPQASDPGDVDCSGSTNAIDAALILQLSAALLGSLSCQENGDLSGDGMINSIDAAIVLQCVAALFDCSSLAGSASARRG